MKNTIKTLAIAAMVASSSVFAWDATDYNDYMTSVNAEINNFNPTAFSGYKNDPAFEALESKLIATVAQMKSYWYVAQVSEKQTQITTPVAQITDAATYLAALNATVDDVNADVFSNFKEDPEFKQLEADLVIIMNAMAKYTK
jgi:hypothetical protein